VFGFEDKKWKKKKARSEVDYQDSEFGFELLGGTGIRLGWLLNYRAVTINDTESNATQSAVDLYFIDQEAKTFKVNVQYAPYILVAADDHLREVETYLRRKYQAQVLSASTVDKEDLDLSNHLSGLQRAYIKLTFRNTQDLVAVRNELLTIIKKNKLTTTKGKGARVSDATDFLDFITDLREFDVLYHMRVAIDLDVRVAYWYALPPGQTHERAPPLRQMPRPTPLRRGLDRCTAAAVATGRPMC
jgi:DNA polymerase epsilon subunit 1